VLRRMRSERVDSALEDPEIHPEGEAQMLGVQAGLWVPLVVRGEAIGVITAADKVGRDPRFSDEDLRLAEAFASRAAGAVELTRRVSRDTVRSMLQGQELERSRLSRDLHDQTGQALAALLLGLNAARRAETLETAQSSLADLDALVREALADVRSIAVRLRPAALDELGLGAALERLASTIGDGTTTAITVTTTLAADRRLPAEIETAVYRIVQEAAANAVRHGGAGRVDVTVVTRPDAVIATIEDNGRGFDPAAVASGRLGLAGMRERANLFNGHLRIESAPGHGATVTAELPLVP
jgi:signal transduction histidine kinase